jgi:uncharacterized protein YabN with tetrapyrrole methylase and pyrophosphatase domain
MKEDFAELFKAVKNNRKFCEWAKSMTSEKYFNNIAEELEEARQALEKKDYENLEEELGDVLWDLMMLAVIAEDEGKINTKNIIKGVLDKMKERKPYIFEERSASAEEAKELWYSAKARQKARKGEKNG